MNLVVFVISTGFVEIVNKSVYGFGGVMGIRFEIKVRNFTSLVEIRLVDEVPWGLVGSSLIFDIISEGYTLDEWVLVLLSGP